MPDVSDLEETGCFSSKAEIKSGVKMKMDLRATVFEQQLLSSSRQHGCDQAR